VPPAVSTLHEQREPVAVPRWRLEVDGGVAMLTAFGARPSLSVTGRYRLAPLELGARGSSVVQTWTVNGIHGSADLGLADARVIADLPLEWGVFTLRPEVSVGAMIGWATGHSTARGYQGQASTTAAFAPALNLCAELVLNGWLSLQARAGAVFALPAIQVDFASSQVANVGLPMFELSLGLSLR
jgi:hypothetical protein